MTDQTKPDMPEIDYENIGYSLLSIGCDLEFGSIERDEAIAKSIKIIRSFTSRIISAERERTNRVEYLYGKIGGLCFASKMPEDSIRVYVNQCLSELNSLRKEEEA